jgi:hypothetical protein
MLRPAAAKAEQSSDNAVLSLDKGGTLEATSRDRKSSESLSRSRLTAPRVALVLGTRESLNLIKIYPAETFYVSGAEGREVGGGGGMLRAGRRDLRAHFAFSLCGNYQCMIIDTII